MAYRATRCVFPSLKAIFRLKDGVLYQLAAIVPPPGTESARTSLGFVAHVYTLAFVWLKLA
jgi:hypothetical protein